MRKLALLLVAVCSISCQLSAAAIYINDAAFTSGNWCTAAGNDATGNGSTSAPYATLSKALSVAAVGDFIRVDVGTYTNQTAITVSLTSVIIEGYSVSSVIFQLTSGTNNFITVTANNVIIKNMTVKGYNSNTALQGKAFTLTNVTDVDLYNILFDGCLSASGGEPPVYISTSSNVNNLVSVTKCSFMNNIGNYGGAIDVCSNTNNGTVTNIVSIDSCYFENNGKFLNNGGAITIYNGLSSGGSTKAPIVTMKANTFGNTCIGNQAMRGGAIYIDNGASLTINNSCFTKNSAIDVAGPDGGGAIWIGAAQVTVNDCKFESNTANAGTPKYGGGVYVNAGAGSTNLKLIRSSFIDNLANRGAGVYSGKANVTMENDLFYSNAASGASSYGGGFAVSNASANITMYNCTFSKNSTTGAGRGDGIDANSGNFSSFDLKNSILYANGSNKELAGGTSVNASWSTIGTSSTAGADYTSVTGNSTLDPLFTNPAGNDFTLSGISSPAYNTGNADGGGAPIVDINNLPRPQFDMGCYALSSTPVLKWTCPNNANLASIIGTDSVICPGQSVTLSAFPSSGFAYVWTSVPAGLSSTSATVSVSPTVTTVYQLQVNNTTSACGSYGTATFTVSIGAGPVPVVKPDFSRICSGSSFNITGSSAATFTWTVSSGTLSSNTGTVVSYTAPIVSVPTTATITCVASNTAGCVSSSPVTETITINPTPTVTPSAASTSICSGATTTLTASGATTYTWSSSLGTLSTLNDDTITFTAPTVTAVTTVTVNLNGTSDSACVNITAGVLTITINPPPSSLSISPSATAICSGSIITFTAGGAATYTWSAGSGTFNTSTSNPTIYNAPNVAIVTPVLISLNGTSAAGCTNSTADTITVFVKPYPVVTLSASTDTMCAGANATLTSNAANSYTWTASPGTLNTYNGNVVFYIAPSTTLAATATITVIGTNAVGCVSVDPDTAFIYIRPSPAMTLSASDSSLCSAQTSTLSAAGSVTYTWTTSMGSVSSNNANPTVYTSPTVTATTVATVTVNGTDAKGCNSTMPGVLTLTVNPIPVITVTAVSSTLCAGTTETLTANGAGTYTWTTTGGTLSSSSGNPITYTAASYTTPTTETITVDGISAAGCPAASSATVALIINPLPQVIATAVDTVLCGGITTTLTASGAGTYSWTITSGTLSSANGTPITYTAPTLTTSSTSTVTLVGTSASGCLSSNTDTVVITNNPVPQITLTAVDSSICSSTTTTLNAGGAISYTWTSASGTLSSNTGTPITYTAPSVSIATTETLSVIGTNTLNCNSVSTSITLTVNPLPTVSAVSSNTTICSNTTATLTGNGASTYSWTAFSGSLSSSTGSPIIYTAPTTTTATTVTLTIDGTSASGCTNTSAGTITISITPESVPSITAASYTTCNGSSISLFASGASTYTWAAGSGTLSSPNGSPVLYTPASVSVTTTSTVSLTGTNAFGCASSTAVTATITTNPVTTPTITLTGSAGICAGNSVVLTSNPSTGIVWNTGSTAASLTVTTAGIFSVTATNSFGCVAASSVITTTLFPVVSAPFITIPGPNFICMGDSAQLSISQTTGVLWQPGGQTTSSIYVNTTGTYTAQYTDLNGCTSPTATMYVQVNPVPVINYSSVVVSPAHCSLQNGSIKGFTVSGSSPYTYTWYDSAGAVIQTGGTSLNPIGPGTYSFQVTDFFGCKAISVSEVVPDLPGIQVTLSATPTSGNTPLTVDFSAQIFNTNVSGGYTWNYGTGGSINTFGSQTQTIYNNGGIYNAIVMVADSFGCKDTATIQIVATELESIVMPNIFTPNGDGINDGFSITTTGIKDVSITIYNRWGEQIISLSGNSIYWVGENKHGKSVPDGTYYYVVNYTNDNGKAKNQTGFITLVR